MIKIVTDSTCDLPADRYRKHDITVVPINIQFGTETYLDRVTIDPPTFYQKIRQSGALPKTSQPSVGQFHDTYTVLAADGATDIVSIHVTSRLSGTYQSAELARELVTDRVRVHTFDSAGGSAGLGFMVLEAVRMAEAGHGVADILRRLEELRSRMQIVFTLQDLHFAQMSGRVGKLQSSLASLLNIKPIVLLEDGIIDVREKARTRGKALDRIVELLVERVGVEQPVHLAVIHAEAPGEAQALLERVKAVFHCTESFVVDMALSLAVQFGPGTLGLVGYRD
jgi:DegV family protein with EDD domain